MQDKITQTETGLEIEGRNGMGDKLTLYHAKDDEEEFEHNSVSWRGHCGYFSVSFKTATLEDAMVLFHALKKVTSTDET